MIPTSALAPLIATTAGSLASEIVKAAARGLSFAKVLHADAQQGESKAATSSRSEPGTVARVPQDGNQDGNTVRLGVLRKQVDRMRESVRAELLRQLEQRGVDLSEPIVLTVDPDGRILESGGNWNRAEIERLFESDARLAGQVRNLFRAQQSLLRGNAGNTDLAESQIRLLLDGQHAVFQVLDVS